MNPLSTFPALSRATMISISGAWASNKGKPAPAVTLTDTGQKLETDYALLRFQRQPG